MLNNEEAFAAPAPKVQHATTGVSDVVVQLAIVATLCLASLNFASAFLISNAPFAYAAWVEDDFFYYAVIARNIAESGLSTFDGVTLTNGYHPLWMGICVLVAGVFEIHSTAYFMTIYLIQVALVVGGVVAFARLAERARQAGVISQGARMLATLVYGLGFTLIGTQGMEIALLAPLMPLLLLALWNLCDRPNLHNALAASAFMCATILSRLDSGLVFAPVCLGAAIAVLRNQGLRKVLSMAPASAAFVPLALYLAVNHVVFGSAVPLSGMAKRIMVDGATLGVSSLGLQSFKDFPNINQLILRGGTTIAAILGVIVALSSRRLRATIPGTGFLLVGLGSAAFYLQTLATSDWRLWIWYFYPSVLAGSFAVGFIFDALAPKRNSGPVLRWMPLILCGITMIGVVKANAWTLRKPPSQSNALFLRALPILKFAKTHPGRYAMGDGAGAVGFVLPNGLIQLEGLVNDAAMLREIRAGGSIEASLRRQNVDYYITSIEGWTPGCHLVHEPAQGGPRASRLSERICEPPVLTFRTGWINTQIWDVRDGLD